MDSAGRAPDPGPGAGAACPRIAPRRRWGAVRPLQREPMSQPAGRAIIHHTALSQCHSPDSCAQELRDIQSLHMRHRGFDDIGYNFLIGGDGSVYEGRGWGIVGAHAKMHNNNSLGIALMGHFSHQPPTPAALSSAQQLLECGVALGHLHPDYTLSGHRDVRNTECPGDQLYSAMRQFAHFQQ